MKTKLKFDRLARRIEEEDYDAYDLAYLESLFCKLVGLWHVDLVQLEGIVDGWLTMQNAKEEAIIQNAEEEEKPTCDDCGEPLQEGDGAYCADCMESKVCCDDCGELFDGDENEVCPNCGEVEQ